jgi:hypothetical protein
MSHNDKKNKLQLEFHVPLSFAQELRETPIDSGIFLPASNTIADPGVKGSAHLRFSPDFLTLDVELNISGDLTGDHIVTLAHLHLDDASKTGPLTVSLYPNNKAVTEIKKNKRFVLNIKLTNDDIVPRNNDSFSTNTICSLYNAVRGNNLYVDTHGSGDYLLGMIRGQIYSL